MVVVVAIVSFLFVIQYTCLSSSLKDFDTELGDENKRILIITLPFRCYTKCNLPYMYLCAEKDIICGENGIRTNSKQHGQTSSSIYKTVIPQLQWLKLKVYTTYLSDNFTTRLCIAMFVYVWYVCVFDPYDFVHYWE